MTTDERQRTELHPPTEHRQKPPLVKPPTPTHKRGRVRWLWWLAALAVIVIAVAASVVLVGDEAPISYVDRTATYGEGILEIWDKPAVTPAPEPVYPDLFTQGPAGTVLEIWDKPQQTPSTETHGPAGNLLEVWDKQGVVEIWDRSDYFGPSLPS